MAVGFDPRKKGLFGRPSDMGGPAAMQIGDPAPGLGMRNEPQRKGRSFLPYALAALEDTMARQMGYAPQGVARLNAAQAQEQEALAAAAADQRKRSLDLADWKWKEDYQSENQSPTAMQRNLEYWQTLTPEQKRAYQEMNPEYRQGADGRFYRIDIGQGAMPTAPVGKLTPITGGSGGNAGGGF